MSAESAREGWQARIERERNRTSVIHITDCLDPDAQLRLSIRSSELIGRTEAFAGVTSDLMAAGLLVEALDALDGAAAVAKRTHQNVILVNVAPRHGSGEKHENGTPFCYFRYKGTLVVATVDGLTLSLLKKFNLIDSVTVLDTRATLGRFVDEGLLSDEEAEGIAHTQFRSLEFVPRVASYLLHFGDLPGARLAIDDVADAPRAVWLVDNFGNCKTTLTLEDVEPDGTVRTAFGVLPFTPDLTDAKPGVPTVTLGSSGTGPLRGPRRYLEIVIKGGRAVDHYQINIGDVV
jgi:hypothetical protein